MHFTNFEVDFPTRLSRWRRDRCTMVRLAHDRIGRAEMFFITMALYLTATAAKRCRGGSRATHYSIS